MHKLRWGTMATGNVARLFVRDMLRAGQVVVAAASRSAEKAEGFRAEFGLARAHGSYEALAADPDVDAIYIATPHPFHLATAEIAIRAGKHVLVEKPFTLNSAEARRLVDLGREHDVVVMEAMWTRFLPHMIRLREVLASGMIGTIRSLVATHNQDLPDDPGHRLNALELGGGALLDLGIYPISFAFDILGAPEQVIASGRLKQTGVDAEVSVILRYREGATAMLLAMSDAAGANRAEINGTCGYVEIDGTWYKPTSFRIFDSRNNLIEKLDAQVEGRGMHFQALEIERLVGVGERSSTIMPMEQSVDIMSVLDYVRAQIGVLYPGETR